MAHAGACNEYAQEARQKNDERHCSPLQAISKKGKA